MSLHNLNIVGYEDVGNILRQRKLFNDVLLIHEGVMCMMYGTDEDEVFLFVDNWVFNVMLRNEYVRMDFFSRLRLQRVLEENENIVNIFRPRLLHNKNLKIKFLKDYAN